MRKIYIAPTTIFENVEDEFLLQTISNPKIVGSAHDHDPNCTCELCLGEDDELAAGKRNHLWDFDED